MFLDNLCFKQIL